VDGLWFLLAIALLRFAWRYIERAARGNQPPPEPVKERDTARERRRVRWQPPSRPERAATPGSQAPGRARLEPDDLLERLRQAVEAASGARAEPPRTHRPAPRVVRAPESFELPSAPAMPVPALALERREERPAVYRRETARVRDLRAILRHRGTLRDAILLREILGPPVAHRDALAPLRVR